MPEEPPMPEDLGQRIFEVPEDPPTVKAGGRQTTAAPTTPKEAPPAAVAGDGNWWRALAENCKGRLPPMYRAFLDMCTGALSGDLLTVYAPDDITLGRLENDRVKSALCEEAEKASGVSIRLMFQVGEPPKASPQKNLQNLLKFGSQFDNIQIK